MTDLHDLKNQVSAALLKKVKAVSGVGLREQGITIYLEMDSTEIREAVAKALETLKLTEPLHWQVVGKIERQSSTALPESSSPRPANAIRPKRQ